MRIVEPKTGVVELQSWNEVRSRWTRIAVARMIRPRFWKVIALGGRKPWVSTQHVSGVTGQIYCTSRDDVYRKLTALSGKLSEMA